MENRLKLNDSELKSVIDDLGKLNRESLCKSGEYKGFKVSNLFARLFGWSKNFSVERAGKNNKTYPINLRSLMHLYGVKDKDFKFFKKAVDNVRKEMKTKDKNIDLNSFLDQLHNKIYHDILVNKTATNPDKYNLSKIISSNTKDYFQKMFADSSGVNPTLFTSESVSESLFTNEGTVDKSVQYLDKTEIEFSSSLPSDSQSIKDNDIKAESSLSKSSLSNEFESIKDNDIKAEPSLSESSLSNEFKSIKDEEIQDINLESKEASTSSVEQDVPKTVRERIGDIAQNTFETGKEYAETTKEFIEDNIVPTSKKVMEEGYQFTKDYAVPLIRDGVVKVYDISSTYAVPVLKTTASVAYKVSKVAVPVIWSTTKVFAGVTWKVVRDYVTPTVVAGARWAWNQAVSDNTEPVENKAEEKLPQNSEFYFSEDLILNLEQLVNDTKKLRMEKGRDNKENVRKAALLSQEHLFRGSGNDRLALNLVSHSLIDSGIKEAQAVGEEIAGNEYMLCAESRFARKLDSNKWISQFHDKINSLQEGEYVMMNAAVKESNHALFITFKKVNGAINLYISNTGAGLDTNKDFHPKIFTSDNKIKFQTTGCIEAVDLSREYLDSFFDIIDSAYQGREAAKGDSVENINLIDLFYSKLRELGSPVKVDPQMNPDFWGRDQKSGSCSVSCMWAMLKVMLSREVVRETKNMARLTSLVEQYADFKSKRDVSNENITIMLAHVSKLKHILSKDLKDSDTTKIATLSNLLDQIEEELSQSEHRFNFNIVEDYSNINTVPDDKLVVMSLQNARSKQEDGNVLVDITFSGKTNSRTSEIEFLEKTPINQYCVSLFKAMSNRNMEQMLELVDGLDILMKEHFYDDEPEVDNIRLLLVMFGQMKEVLNVDQSRLGRAFSYLNHLIYYKFDQEYCRFSRAAEGATFSISKYHEYHDLNIPEYLGNKNPIVAMINKIEGTNQVNIKNSFPSYFAEIND